MFESFEKIARIIISACLALSLFCLCFLFAQKIFKGTEDQNFTIYLLASFLSIGALSAYFLRKYPLLFFPQLITMFLLTLGIFFYPTKKSPNSFQTHYAWLSNTDMFSLPFLIGKHGHILLEAQVNDTSGLFLFDTGASLSTLHEGIPGNKELDKSYTLTDAQGIRRSKKLQLSQNFHLGKIKVHDLPFWPIDSLAWKDGGPFAGQDEVIGIIGNNFLTHYVWDFDMVYQKVSLSSTIETTDRLENSSVLPLINKNGNWFINVVINGENKELLLDFGFTTSIRLQDSLKNDAQSQQGYALSQSSSSAFSHTTQNSTQKDTVAYTLANHVQVGDFNFTNVMCVEEQYNNLIGLQLLWAFDRLILDYPSRQMYVFRTNKKDELIDLEQVNLDKGFELQNIRQMQKKGYYELKLNYYYIQPTLRITQQEDTIKGRFLFYGTSRHWGKSYFKKDSIISLDSVRLPNGEVKQAPYTLDLSQDYFVDP